MSFRIQSLGLLFRQLIFFAFSICIYTIGDRESFKLNLFTFIPFETAQINLIADKIWSKIEIGQLWQQLTVSLAMQ